MLDKPLRICILGGGFGGLYTALRLSQLPWENAHQPEIILIDKNDRFLFSPLLYELVTGEMRTWEIAPPFEELLANTGIVFYQACVTNIDVEGKRIQLDNCSDLAYDRLVIAMGGKTPLNTVPGALMHAIPFRSLSDAYRLNEKLRILEESKTEYIRVAVVGAGYSGVELACKLADRLGDRGRIRLIEKSSSILGNSPDYNRKAATKALEARRIWVDLETEIEQVESDSLSLVYKGEVDTIPIDIVLWTVGNQVSNLIQSLPLKHDERGLIVVNAYLQAIDRPEIFAIGDVASGYDADEQKFPSTAQAALQQSDYCAWNIWASVLAKPLLPFRYQALGEMMGLGIDDATICGMGLKLDGILAYVTRRLIYLYRLPTLKHQLAVGFNWMTQPLAELLSK